MCLRSAQRRPRNSNRILAQDHINLAFHIMRRKELAFLSVRRSNHDSETALRLLETDRQDSSPCC